MNHQGRQAALKRGAAPFTIVLFLLLLGVFRVVAMQLSQALETLWDGFPDFGDSSALRYSAATRKISLAAAARTLCFPRFKHQ
ncbi:MAG: hypothetical protein NTY53_19275 [Kiritimatiellaeota bacterium]|nr:hypothetical protein [Kiritimatiellota bacterium]